MFASILQHFTWLGIEQETIHRLITYPVNTSCNFYLFSIKSKNIYSSKIHLQIHNFDLPFLYFFFKQKKSRVTQQKCITHTWNCSHPFCLLVLKFYSSEFHSPMQDFYPPIFFLFFFGSGIRSGKHDIDWSHIDQIVNISYACYQYALNSFTAQNSIHKDTTLTC